MTAIHVAIITNLAVVFCTYSAFLIWPTRASADLGALVRTVLGLVFTFVMTILMNQRSARLVAERQRLRGEMESAVEVQSLLLNSQAASGDAYRIEPVYLPASEVGGDFYQTLDRADGARLVLVGDVSGKGLKAAMLVSVVVGILRNDKSASPGAVLRALNEGLSGHVGGGFVTCCCARFDRDGTVTIASAGHLAPYCDGREVTLETGLPLGIVAEAEYPETVVSGASFTLITDGVVEAANATGELFGFDRTREIAMKPAAEIAEAARQWGQNDDITVVTVRRSL